MGMDGRRIDTRGMVQAFTWCARNRVSITFDQGGVYITVPGLGRFWGASFTGLCRNLSARLDARRKPKPNGDENT
jgi:hypothetical protein